MLKITQTFLFFILSIGLLTAQEFNNDWINYNQTYVKFKVVEDGLCRIDRNTLVGIDNGFITANPRNIQVFARGEEQAIYVHGENDFSFDSGDYIELYCQKNDGFLDRVMYDDPAEQNNPYHSMINDTIAYFITWENSPEQKKRYQTYSSANYASLPVLNQVKQKTLESFTNGFYEGQRTAHYSSGKGWFNASSFVYDAPTNETMDIPNRLAGANVKVNFSVCGAPNSAVSSVLNHHLKVHCNSIEKYDATYVGYEGVQSNFTFNSENINGNDLDLKFSANYELNGQVDRNTLAYVMLEYNRNLQFTGVSSTEFYIENVNESKQLNLSGWTNTPTVLYNIDGLKRTLLIQNSGQATSVIPPITSEEKIIISASDSIQRVTAIETVNFFNYRNLSNDPNYLMVFHKSLASSANHYAFYRKNQGHEVLLAEISDLYDQFAFGIEKHPVAIQDFVHFISEEYSTPKFLLLLGKSINSANVKNNASAFENCLVPTMGYPSSDVLITSKLNPDGIGPLVATGRISARNNNDLETYLKKVQEYETSEDGLWKKKGIHFGGGNYTSEQSLFKSYLNEYKQIYEDTLIGGEITTFLKNSSDPIQISVSDSVKILINSGVSQMTFFGHGSTSGFDQNIDGPENYNNAGKYPLILANSCHSGDIHLNTSYRTISEEWVLIANKGSIGFLADADLGYPTHLYQLAKSFYKSLSSNRYGYSIGEIIQESLQRYSSSDPMSLSVRKTVYDNTYHGDPAVVINSFAMPDLQIENSSIRFNPDPITTEVDSFELNIFYQNIGRAFVDTFLISIEREWPSGQKESYNLPQYGCLYDCNTKIMLAVDPLNGVGLNKLNVKIDYLSQIDELNELNNSVDLQFFIQSNDLLPIFPNEFAVVSKNNIKLKASSADVFSGDFNALFQIDTVDSFDSPFMQSQQVATNGGITEWTLPFVLSDSTVYFWKVSRQGTDRWRNSSFRYIEGETGWSQGHHHQFANDDYQFIDYYKESRDFKFITTPKTLLCENIGSVPGGLLPEVGFWIDGVGDNNSCGGASALNVVVIDPVTLQPWASDIFDYGHRQHPKCGSRNRPDFYFQFTTTDTTWVSMESLAEMIELVPDSFHILIYSLWNGNFKQLPEVTKQAVESLHPTSGFRNLENNLPYILYAKKGDIGLSKEVFGATTTEEISLSVDLPTNFNYGKILSSKIGPAKEWKSMHWQHFQNIDTKRTEIKIHAVDHLGNNSLLLGGFDQDSLNVLNLSSRIDAETYPYLRLEMFCKDSIDKVPTQLKSWSLLFDEAPETAIDIDDGYFFNKDTIEQGEEIVFSISTRNVSYVDMDSLKVSYFVKDDQNQVQLIESKKLRPHPSDDVIQDTVRFNTLSSRGTNSIWVEFNGLDSLTGEYDQLEQHHFNNLATKYFYVETDRTNPLLNVTFDGMYIMDGDIIAPKPEVLIKIKDENRFLALEDPDLVSIYLKAPNSEEEMKVNINDSLSNQQLYWTPSTLPDNTAEMLFTPQSLEDGMYTLRVGARDASFNESGQFDYKISFEVINKSTITEILNYPNPFSTSTQFVFTLTGAEVPDEIVIQIMTVTGKVVKEIDLTASSSLNIGRNITDYKWDGKDEYGDVLANGVYFYRVFVKMNGNEVEKSSNAATKFFKEGIGKMYIMR